MFSCVFTCIPASLTTKSLPLSFKSATPMPEIISKECTVRRKKRSSRFPPHVFTLPPHSSRLTSCLVLGKLLPAPAYFSALFLPFLTTDRRETFRCSPIASFYILNESPPFNCRYSRNLFRKVRILIPRVLAACVRLPSWRSRVFKISSRSISQIVPLGALA